MLHAKVMLYDDDLAVIGSANLDSRSFRLNFEASCFVGGKELNSALAQCFEADLARCIEVRLDAFQNRPWHAQVIDAAAHLMSPLL
jgi:cardiolipin synthase